jgi:hypothetical protein
VRPARRALWGVLALSPSFLCFRGERFGSETRLAVHFSRLLSLTQARARARARPLGAIFIRARARARALGAIFIRARARARARALGAIFIRARTVARPAPRAHNRALAHASWRAPRPPETPHTPGTALGAGDHAAAARGAPPTPPLVLSGHAASLTPY